jgi:beta-phosphoglucomutase
MALRAIVFDFDGVIADSEPLHFQAFHEILAEAGIPLGEGDYYARYLGFSDAGVFEAVGQDHGLGWNADRVSQLMSSGLHGRPWSPPTA